MSPARRKRRRIPVRKDRSPLRLVGAVATLVILLLVVAGGWTIWNYGGPGPRAQQGEVTTVVLDRGTGLTGIANQLKDAGVIRSEALFVLAAKLTGAAGTLKAGEYEIRSGASLGRILADIRAGRVVRHMITVPEGWTSEMAAEAVNAQPVLVGTAVAPPEGTLLPDTYQVQRGDDRSAVIQRMRRAQEQLLAEAWPRRQQGLPFTTQQEALTLASIVEKETAVPAERPRIAAVYINRLRQGMPLQSDPTVIYGVSKGRALGRGITRSELDTPTPYNTYQIAGLPPTPIANPGRAAIEAVLNPPSTDELYFVASGDGGHAFAATYAEHQRNVARWRAIESQRAAAAAAR